MSKRVPGIVIKFEVTSNISSWFKGSVAVTWRSQNYTTRRKMSLTAWQNRFNGADGLRKHVALEKAVLISLRN